MTAEQLPLAEPDQDDDEDYDDPSLPTDLRGQGIPYDAHITDIPITGSYL